MATNSSPILEYQPSVIEPSSKPELLELGRLFIKLGTTGGFTRAHGSTVKNITPVSGPQITIVYKYTYINFIFLVILEIKGMKNDEKSVYV